MTRCIKTILLVVCFANLLFGHGGGLDSNGGHMDHKTGIYHYHNSPTAPAGFLGGFSDSGFSGEQRRARLEARKKAKQEAEIRKPQRVLPTRGEANFLFHDVESGPYQVSSFVDNNKNWKCLLASGFNVQLQKERIIRIEPISDPSDFRTWFDRSGKYSLVAKHIEHDESIVSLEKLDERQITVEIARLSEVDQQYLRKIDSLQKNSEQP